MPLKSEDKEVTVFYDGGCALCHSFVRFVIAYGPPDILFAPVDGRLTRTIQVQLDDGLVLKRSDALISVLRRCGGFWRVLAELAGLVPRSIRNWIYDAVAAVRYRIFGRANAVCPVVSPELRTRFLPPEDERILQVAVKAVTE